MLGDWVERYGRAFVWGIITAVGAAVVILVAIAVLIFLGVRDSRTINSEEAIAEGCCLIEVVTKQAEGTFTVETWTGRSPTDQKGRFEKRPFEEGVFYIWVGKEWMGRIHCESNGNWAATGAAGPLSGPWQLQLPC